MRAARHSTLATDRGDMAIEAAIVGPVLLLFMFTALLVAGRSVQAKNQAESAAQEAARAASLEQTPAAAVTAGKQAMEANIGDATGLTCTAEVNADSLEPGSIVAVDVTCDTDFVAGQGATFTATAAEVVDQYREGESP